MQPRIPLPAELEDTPFTTERGLASGLGRNRLRGRDLDHPFRGVHRSNAHAPDVRALCHALHIKLPAYARFCGVTAAVLLGVPLPHRHEISRTLHVAVPRGKRTLVGSGIAGHTYVTHPFDEIERAGLRLSSPQRLWLELGSELTVPELVAAGDYLVHRQAPHTTIGLLVAALHAHRGRRGLRTMQTAIGLLNERTESPAESRLRVALVLSGLPDAAVNHPIRTSGGFRYRADLAYVRHKLIVEYQSEFHNSPAAFRADMTRVSRLEADGWRVMFVNNDDLENPPELVSRIRRMLTLAREISRAPH